jgi:hypothetical protein
LHFKSKLKLIMKKIFSRKMVTVVFGITTILFANSCTKLTDNLSTDPVNITDPKQVTVPLLISGVEVSLIGIYEGDVARTAGIWGQYFDGEDRQYAGLNNYVTSGLDYDNEWITIFNGVFNNTRLIKSKSNAVNNFFATGVAQVMEGMTIGTAADLWGDVPYTEIAKYPKIPTPKFDSQASVYAAAQVLLDSAINNLGKSGVVGVEDFFYSGSTAKWKAAAHTIKARLYLHTRDYTNALAQASLGIGVGGDMMAPHGNAYLQTFNLYYSFLTYDRSGYMAANAAYAPTLLDPNDPNYRGNGKTNENGRFNYYYAPYVYYGGLNTGAKYDPNVVCSEDAGVPWNKFFGFPAVTYDGAYGCSTPFPILTYVENQLILAEANAKLGNFNPAALKALNNVRDYYNTGALFGTSTGYITDADLGGVYYSDYVMADFAPGGMANNGVDDQNTALLREILEERYVSFIGQIEGWNDERRTHNFLNLPTAPGKPSYPERLLYSQIEVNTNPNVPSTGVGLFDKVASFSTAY